MLFSNKLINAKNEKEIKSLIRSVVNCNDTKVTTLDIKVNKIKQPIKLEFSIVYAKNISTIIRDCFTMDSTTRYENEIVSYSMATGEYSMCKYVELVTNDFLRVSINIPTTKQKYQNSVCNQFNDILSECLKMKIKQYNRMGLRQLLDSNNKEYLSMLFTLCEEYDNFTPFNNVYKTTLDNTIELSVKLVKENSMLEYNTLFKEDANKYIYYVKRDENSFYEITVIVNKIVRNSDVKQFLDEVNDICIEKGR